MQHFENGDLVLLINSIYHPEIIGHIGTITCGESQVTAYDRYDRLITGNFAVVDLPNDINRYGTTLWYLKPGHLIKIKPGSSLKPKVTRALTSL